MEREGKEEETSDPRSEKKQQPKQTFFSRSTISLSLFKGGFPAAAPSLLSIAMRLQGATAGATAAASSSCSSSSSRGGVVSFVPRSVALVAVGHQRRAQSVLPPSRRPACPPALALSSLAELAALSAGAEEQLQAALNAMAAAALEAEAAAVDPSLAAGDGRAALSAVSQAALDAGAAASGALPAAVDGLLGPLLRFFAADIAGTFSFPPRPESALRIGVRRLFCF